MKCGARFLILLAAVTACSSSSQTAAERAAAAARADSSAAGYDVGPVPTAAVAARSDPDTTSKAGTPSTVLIPDSGRPLVAAGSTDTTARSVTVPDTSTRAGRGGSGGSQSGSGSRSGSARRDSGASTLAPLDPTLEPDFIAYDTARKTVTFQLAAGDEIADQVSFNGVQRGARTLTVPLGWRVTVAFANRDPHLPHSATIVDVAGAVPEQLPEPVFSRAQTVRMEEGLLEGDSDEMMFTADRVGRFMIACGVIGHAQRGQWVTLDVSTMATKPTYR